MVEQDNESRIKKLVKNQNLYISKIKEFNLQQQQRKFMKSNLKKEDQLILIEKAKQGSEEAFTELYNRYKAMIKNMGNKYLSNRMDSQDLVQIVFIKAFKAIKQYEPKYKFATWLFKIAKHVVIDEYRTKKGKNTEFFSESEEGESFALNVADSEKTPQQLVENFDRYANLHRMISELQSPYKELIVARYMQEKTYEEIAEEFQRPLGTIKAQLNRARTLLKEILEKEPFAV